jgi:diguanylate cyclase (GGDEF)-like protein/PAS domain S-box-containing protein
MGRTSRTFATESVGAIGDSHQVQLLVVGLDADRRMRFEYRLLEAGFALRGVAFAATLAEARSDLQRISPECILVDLGLPEPSGVHAVTVLTAAAPEVPVVVMSTADCDSDLIYEALNAGAVDHIVDEGWQPIALREVITRAYRRHEELRVSNDQRLLLSSVLDSAEGPACVIDGSGRIVAVNASWTAGAETREAYGPRCGVGVNYLDVCARAAGPDAEGALEAADGIRAVLEGKVPRFVLEYPCTLNGYAHWFALRVAPFGARGGGAVVVHQDISALRQAERKFQEGSEWVRRMLEEEHPVFALVAPNGTISHVSESTLRMLGRQETSIGLPSFFSIELHDREVAAECFARVLEKPGARDRALIHVVDGTGRVRELDLEICNRVDDPLLGAVTVAGSDVTEKRRDQVARRLESRLLQALPAAVVVCDERDVIVYWNAEATRAFGHDAAQTLGRPVLDVAIWPPEVFDGESSAVTLEDGRWEGEHDARRPDGTTVPVRLTLERVDDDGIDFHGVVAAAVDITARRELELDLAYRALHDPLTKLPNRHLFVDHLQRALSKDARNGLHTAVFSADLDDFKAVNDSLGHELGDALLRSVAQRLCEAVRPGDVVAHFGGDEFVVCCEGLAEHEEAIALAERIRQTLEKPDAAQPDLPPVAVSIGVAVSEHDSQPEGLLRNADIAMFLAKEKGRAHVEMFDDERHRRARENFEMATDLEEAVDLGEIEVVYQPLYVLESGELYGFEALARWTHPEWGPVTPSDFIRAAERSGSIALLGERVLARACRMLATALRRRDGKRLSMTVNVSALQLADPAFPRMVRRVVKRSGVPPECVCLEVTESALTDAEMAADALATLRALGVQTSIDDFGTEYLSLARLHQFPIDYLKIDKSFVAGLVERPVDAAIVHALLGLASSLGIRSVAEGVEDANELRLLTDAGCDLGQGFYWSKPLPTEEALGLVRPD